MNVRFRDGIHLYDRVGNRLDMTEAEAERGTANTKT